MSHVTARKLGKSSLTLDWTSLGSPDSKAFSEEDLNKSWKTLHDQFDQDKVGFYFSPTRAELSQVTAARELADQIRSQNQFTDCLFLGIGGSALGPISVLSALEYQTDTSIRFHFLENPDPIHWSQTLQSLQPESTLVVVVTKSGGTFETISLFLLALEWLEESRWKTHVVGLTDPTHGDLRKFIQENEIRSLEIAPSIGGRFSIFSPVGLFPMALSGLDVDRFLKGAEEIQSYCETTPPSSNAIFHLANTFVSQSSHRSTHVCMPYSTPLRLMGDWWVQLWGESLGKDGKGFNPIAAVGATDQHSLLQLLNEGPDDKLTLFITVDREASPKIVIPQIPHRSLLGLDSVRLLQGHSLQDLLHTEYQATSHGLSRRSRPHCTIQLDGLNEESLGALYFFFSILTAFTGTLWQINPFDQPGVESGKIFIREALSQNAQEQYDENDENSAVGRLRRHHPFDE